MTTATTPATDADILEIEARHGRATPGPYRRDCSGAITAPWTNGEDVQIAEVFGNDDARFYKYAHQDIPSLLLRIKQDGERIKGRDQLLTHVLHEVTVLEDFDAESLRIEIEEMLSGSKTFDDNKALWTENERLQERIKGLEAALAFYANPISYYGSNNMAHRPADNFGHPECPYRWDVMRDHGGIARTALAPKDTVNDQS